MHENREIDSTQYQNGMNEAKEKKDQQKLHFTSTSSKSGNCNGDSDSVNYTMREITVGKLLTVMLDTNAITWLFFEVPGFLNGA